MTPADVAAKLKAKGQAITVTRTSAGIFDPVTGATTGAVVQTFTVYGITKNFSTLARYGGSNMTPNTMVLAGDKQAVVAADQVVLLPADVLTIAGGKWVIIALDSVSPTGIDLLYNCHIRK